MATNGALVAIMAAQAAAQRRVYEAFRVAGATAPERARSLESLGLSDARTLESFTKQEMVREAAPGLFWLDERKVAERSRARIPAAKLVLLITALVALGLIGVAVLLNLRHTG